MGTPKFMSANSSAVTKENLSVESTHTEYDSDEDHGFVEEEAYESSCPDLSADDEVDVQEDMEADDGVDEDPIAIVSRITRSKQYRKYYQTYKRYMEKFIQESDDDRRMGHLLTLQGLLAATGKNKIKGMSIEQLATKMLNTSIRTLIGKLTSTKLSWHAMPGVDFIANSVVQLLVDGIEYGATRTVIDRIVKQTTETLNVPSRILKNITSKNKKTSEKTNKKLQKALVDIHGWSFIYSMKICIATINAARIKALALKLNEATPANEDRYSEIQQFSFPIASILKWSIDVKYGHVPLTPFRLHVLRLLVNLQNSCQLYIPLTMPLINMAKEVATLMRKSVQPKPDNEHRNRGQVYTCIRVSAGDIHKAEVADDAWDHITTTMTIYFASLALHPSFPDVIDPVVKYMKMINPKQIPVKCSKRLQVLAKLARETATVVERIRDDVDLAKVPSGMLSILPYIYPKYKNLPLYKEYTRAITEEKDKLDNLRNINVV